MNSNGFNIAWSKKSTFVTGVLYSPGYADRMQIISPAIDLIEIM